MTAAVLGSLVLTATASSAPLANAWSGIDQTLIGIGQTLQRYFPAGGPGTRIQGISFGQSSAITGRWVTDNTPALTIAVPAGDEHIYYWRAIAYDRFDLNGWSLSGTDSTTLEPGTAILGGTREEEDGHRDHARGVVRRDPARVPRARRCSARTPPRSWIARCARACSAGSS